MSIMSSLLLMLYYFSLAISNSNNDGIHSFLKTDPVHRNQYPKGTTHIKARGLLTSM